MTYTLYNKYTHEYLITLEHTHNTNFETLRIKELKGSAISRQLHKKPDDHRSSGFFHAF
jgi:hypothetical protein